ncbi:unnamed protein product [Symbiodinium natans]|uniref:Uncharacterized protein n=1 Tax=Symbiodinium natans TaxID=878477 RepID=A0A812KZE1_9DINO|nr:unnamed protein product [Symbiodinium natans]
MAPMKLLGRRAAPDRSRMLEAGNLISASLGITLPKVELRLSDTFDRNAASAGPRDLAQFLWAAATLRAPLPSLHGANFDALTGQAAVTSLWSLSTLEKPRLLPALARQAMLAQLSPMEWANSLWALANAGIHDPKYFELAKALQRVLA